MSDFADAAAAAGFDGRQVQFMEEWLALNGHEHTAEDIVDFDEAVEEVVGPGEDDDEDEGEDDEDDNE